jgi:hypothetical protein
LDADAPAHGQRGVRKYSRAFHALAIPHAPPADHELPMTIDASAQIDAGERAALPPPRPFGETNTLTVASPRDRRGRHTRPLTARLVEVTTDPGATVRASVVAADPSAITLTF